jgi:group II intron reverse transcriptase/maturase
LRALHTALMTQYVNWVLDADIRRFFDSVSHEWVLRLLAHRVADRRILGLIRGWLTAGVCEGTTWSETVEGTPQGAGISPLLANIVLHYALDLWAHQWRRRHARGRVVIVRYADDFVMGFQYEDDAQAMLAALRERLAGFGLTLHDDKTRVLEFGRRSSEERTARGAGRPSTFAFLGFTHHCARSREGRFVVKRRTDRQRMSRKLQALRLAQRRRMHAPLADQHRWLCGVLRGHYRYYGLPSNWHRMDAFYDEVIRGWFRALNRRSQRRLTWGRFLQWLDRFPLPRARVFHTREALA